MKKAILVSCGDSRCWMPATEHLVKMGYGQIFLCSRPGANKTLAEGQAPEMRDEIETYLSLGGEIIFFAGHDGCAKNPAPQEEQTEHDEQAKAIVEGFGLGIKKFLFLWVCRTGSVFVHIPTRREEPMALEGTGSFISAPEF